MAERKTSEQIRKEILSHLREQPLSIDQLRKKIDSNWSTINNYLDLLKKEGKVKELFFRGNLRLFTIEDYPVFYRLPLDKEIFKKCLFLLSKIAEKWEEKKKEKINKTTMQKIAVKIAKDNPELGIPIVRFHYGKVLPVFLESAERKEILKRYIIKKESSEQSLIIKIEKEIDEGCHSNIAWKEKINQYKENEDMRIYLLADEVSFCLSHNKIENIQEILDKFYEIFLLIPASKDYSYVFEKYHLFLEATTFILNSKQFNESKDNDEKENYLKEILDTFNSLWQALTTEFFFQDIEPFLDKAYQEIKEEVKERKINAYSFEISEKVDNLLEYKKHLTPQKRGLDEDEKKILNVFLEGAYEE